MEQPPRRAGHHAGIWASLIVALAMLRFTPLLLSITEDSVFDTHHVEDACRAIGVHGLLGRLYESVGID
jgi:hypothetical protein